MSNDIAAMQDQTWIRVQQKTFTRWCNTYLVERMMKIEDLVADLADGLNLHALLEIISSKTIQVNKRPRIRMQQLENLTFSLEFLKREGIKLVGIGPGDIAEGNQKLILGLIWTIILRYQIQVSEGASAKQELLEWVRSKIPEYDIKNFTNDWTSGKAIAALAEAVLPGQMNLPADFTNDPVRDAHMGITKAHQNMNIPPIIDAEDMVHSPDELSNMTYISYFRDYLDLAARRADQELFERTPVAGKCIAQGPGLMPGNEAGIETHFTIQAINGAGRPVPCGGHAFPVVIKGPSGFVPSNTVDNNNGTYYVTYTPTEEGNHEIGITFNNQHIQKSPVTVYINPARADARQCKIYGPGIESAEAHVPTHFTIEARNKLGERIAKGGQPFVTQITDPFGEPLRGIDQHDNGDGTYTVNYTPVDAGNHVITVSLLRENVADSPYHVNAIENQNMPSPNLSFAEGPGLEPGNKQTEPANFKIFSILPNGQPKKTGGDLFDVQIEGPDGRLINPAIKDNGDGTYDVEYQPQDSGKHHVDVILRNPARPVFYQHLKNSPVDVDIAPGTDASNSIAYGPGIEPGNLDTAPTYFTIQARDKNGNNMPEGGDPFEVKIQGPDGEVPAQVTDNGDGTYRVDYEPKTAGPHNIDVDLNGKPIKGSTFKVVIKPGAWAEKSTVEDFNFTIRTKDKRGAFLSIFGGDDVKAKITSPSGQDVPTKVKDNRDGSFTVSYKLPAETGSFAVEVLLNGEHIVGSPFTQIIA
eukprot:TRINITY_DN206_c0_g1_i1.p1 TRINITY_DN206_c0_g1~~TRINITY_DN206_c0_g1_i1.p1  ORF type:complete len:754 (-),score=220.15 TRINITY_DN206_c0_g1_i1:24-2285(-)